MTRCGALADIFLMLCGVVMAAFAAATTCTAQYLPNVSGTTRSPVDIPQTNLTPVAPPAYSAPNYGPSTYSGPITAPPSATLGAPLFDPYSTGANPGTFAPAIQGVPPVSSPQFPGWLPSANQTQGPGLFGGLFSGTPASGTPTFGVGNPGFGQPNYGSPSFPASAYPASSPNTLFPGGLFRGGSFAGASGGALGSTRFFQGPRLRYGWINDGNGATDLEMNDIDTSLVFAFQNFLYSGQPVYVVPSFGLHLLDGPSQPPSVNGSPSADLPPQLYDAFLDTGWQSDPNRLLGADLGFRIGVFSDFDTLNSDSLRILFKGLLTFRLTPYSTIKGGIYYLDRNRIKLLPAFGLLYQPTAFTRYDLFFPQPKVSQYFRTIGTQDVWVYAAGDYGGGAWTVTRSDSSEQSIDINDLRVLVGLEWGRSDLIRNGRHTGFFEVGYVFDREVLYKQDRNDDFDPGSAFMLRLGFGY